MVYTYDQLRASINGCLYRMALLTGRRALDNPNATEFLVMAASHESHAGEYRVQLGGGPALGLYQIEPDTHDSIWDECDIIDEVARRCGYKRNVALLENDDAYSTFIARMYLAMDKNPLPSRHDVFKMAEYCKSYWNRTGKATKRDYLVKYELFREGEL